MNSSSINAESKNKKNEENADNYISVIDNDVILNFLNEYETNKKYIVKIII